MSSAGATESTIAMVDRDQTVQFLTNGYPYISRMLRDLDAIGADTRFMGRQAVMLSGREAAKLFYDNDKFIRAGAVPNLVRLSLFGKGTVQALDDAAHLHRKAMFTGITDPSRVTRLVELVETQWQVAVERWQQVGRARLFDEAVRVLGVAVCQWAGLPTGEGTLARHAVDMATIVDNFGAVGPGRLRARWARDRANRWARVYIEATRQGLLNPAPDTALYAVAHHRDADGQTLEPQVAADELINVLRPTVAVAWFVVFAALAMHRHPQWRHGLAWGDDVEAAAFAHELRRFYPFAPVLAARTRHQFQWHGHEFPAGRWVILDLYGTNHDPRHWDEPERFEPSRFVNRPADAFEYLPHGGGDADTGHRCPGEDITTRLLTASARQLARLDYCVPDQDLTYSYSRFPSRVRSGFIVTDVSPTLPAPAGWADELAAPIRSDRQASHGGHPTG
jgi:fatty-acid peroxygenase